MRRALLRLAPFAILSMQAACHGGDDLSSSGTTSGGMVPSCAEPCPWSARIGAEGKSTGPSYGEAVAALPDGGAVVPYSSKHDGAMDMEFRLRRYNAHGAIMWDQPTFPFVKVAAGDGHVIVAGEVDLGVTPMNGATFQCASNRCLAVAELDDAGSFVWAKTWEKGGAPEMVAASAGGIAVIGFAGAEHDLGQTQLGEGFGSWVLALTPSGDEVFRTGILAAGGNCQVEGTHVAVSASGTVTVSGDVCKDVDIQVGAASVTAPVQDPAQGWAFVVGLDQSGNLTWGKNLGSGTWASLAFASDGGAIIAGTVRDTIDLGGGPIAGTPDGLTFAITRLAPDGGHVWTQTLTASGGLVAVGPDDRVVTASMFSGSLTFAGTTLTSAGGDDALLATFEAGGQPLSARSFGTSGDDGFSGLSLTALGDPVVAIGSAESLDFGQGPLVPLGSHDVCVAKLAL